MNNESLEQHIILITMLLFVSYLTYCAIPSPEPVESRYKISKKMQIEMHQPQKEEKEIVPKEIIVAEAIIKEEVESSAIQQKTKIEKQKVETKVENAKKTAQIDIIPMNNPVYKAHKKGIVQFAHKKHVEEYLIVCGSCHHDKTGQPLELTFKDNPKSCIECHKGTQQKKGEKLGKKEKIMKYHFEALHANCVGCHKDYNKKNGDPKGKSPAPTSCKKCHLKK
jgi:hypothetical protein